MTDLRYALRSLGKTPGFVTIAVVALGVGLGLSTTMFAVLDAVVHPYVAFRNPDQLYRVNWWFGRRNPMSSAELYRYIRNESHSFEGVIPVGWDRGILERNGQSQEVQIIRVTPRWFALMGVAPRLGRGFSASDGEDVAVVGNDAWKRLFGARARLEGATLTIGGRPIAVVGVLPRGATGGVLMPMSGAVESSSVALRVMPTVRLRAGVTRAQAEVELKQLAQRLTERFAARDAPFAFEMYPIVDRREELRDIHKAMVGSALAVLIIACVNLAHLMMTRGLAKRREFALRMALGASRAAVVRQMFTECAIITLGGATLGALVAFWGADILQNRMPREVSWIGLVQPQLSWRVFALGGLAAAASAILFGLVPAVRVAFGVNLDDPLKDDAGTTTGRVRYRYNPLVVAEVGLALVLMMGGGLLLRTVHGLQREREETNEETLWQGYVFTRQTGDTPSGYDNSRPRPSRSAILSIVSATPGVRGVALESTRGVRGGVITGEMTQDSNRTFTMREYPVVSPSYFEVRGLPILKGRDFEPGDAAGSRVAIVDALAAQRLYPGEEAVGRMVKLGGPAVDAPWVRIVGIVRSPRLLQGDARYAPQPMVWVAMTDTTSTPKLVIRTASPDPKIAATFQTRLHDLPGVGVSLWPWNYSRKAELASRGFLAKVFVGMGAVALGLAALGLYGVLAYAVSRRMREFAVRVALGAEPKALLKMVLHDGFVMLLGGIGVGAFAALAASRLLDSVLIAVLPSDVTSLVLCEVVLIAAGLAAALGPARRAARANPMDILRAV